MPLKLSEAIRLGSMSTEKCRGFVCRYDGARCALGAAALAIGSQARVTGEAIAEMRKRWPWTRLMVNGPEPILIGEVSPLPTIVYLNDQTNWSREQIADWVATIEPPEPAPEPEVVAIEPKATEAA